MRPFATLLSCLIVALSLATVAGELGRYHWSLDLFVHFKLQYAAAFTVCALACLWTRQRALAAAAVVATVFHAWPAASLAYRGLEAAPVRAAGFRLVAFNAAFWNDRYAEIGAFLESTQADAVVLLEYDSEQLDALARFLPSYSFQSADSADLRFGAAILSRTPLLRAESIPLAPGGAVAAHAEIEAPTGPIRVYAVHLNWPASPDSARLRNAELDRLADILAGCRGSCVVAGDFNITPWSAHFRDFQRRSGWRNCARGHGLVATWPAPIAPLGIQIDQCLSSPEVTTTRFAVGPAMGSDHAPIVVDLAVP